MTSSLKTQVLQMLAAGADQKINPLLETYLGEAEDLCMVSGENLVSQQVIAVAIVSFKHQFPSTKLLIEAD